jgi:tetratricopeptide (TPR) repeat protein
LIVALMLADRNAEGADQAHAALARDAAATRDLFSMLLAIAQLRAGEAAAAQTTLAEIKTAPAEGPVQLGVLRALCETALGRTDQAVQIVEKAEELTPAGREAFVAMIRKQPAETMKAAAGSLAFQLYLASRPLYDGLAITMADKTLALLPDEPFVLARKAESLDRTGRIAEALRVYEQIEEQMPGNTAIQLSLVDLHANLALRAKARGQAEEAAKEYEAAIETCRRVLQARPEMPDALDKMAFLHQDAGKAEEANAYYLKAIQIDPKNWKAYNNLAWNLAEGGKLDEAAEMSAKALKILPDSGGIQDTAGWIEMQRGDTARALELFQAAARSIPNNADIRLHLAQALEKAGNKDEAVRQLDTIMLATPDFDKMPEVRSMRDRLNGVAPAAGAGKP